MRPASPFRIGDQATVHRTGGRVGLSATSNGAPGFAVTALEGTIHGESEPSPPQ